MPGRPVTLAVAVAAVVLVALPSVHPVTLQAADSRRDGSLDVVLGELPSDYVPEVPDAPQGGALVVEVFTGGAGDRKGLREGDIVVEFNGTRVHNPWDLAGLIRRAGEGALVSLTVWRDGKREWLGVATLSGREWVTVIDDEVNELFEKVELQRGEIEAQREEIDALRGEISLLREQQGSLSNELAEIRNRLAISPR
jgi:membrane-associated protease RseP (regulator of RpoE activity)